MITVTDFFSLLQETFVLKGVIAAIVAGLLCGMVGPYMAWKNLGLFGASLSHAALFPIAIAMSLAIPFQFLLYPFVILLALLIAYYKKQNIGSLDSYLAIFYSGFMALGILLFIQNGEGSSEVIHYLFGEILVITNTDLTILLCLFVLITIFAVCYRRTLLLNVLQADIAQIEIKNSLKIHYISYLLMALSIAACIKIMGIVLLTSLLIVPTMIASRYTNNIRQHFSFCLIVGALISLFGILLAILFNLPSGASIAALAMCSFFISAVFPKKS